MKPGLRKVAALILATATLFGSGASAVSAAYADDTTMGTSTRIQTEPDVKTTTGGDEAGTGADEQSGTGAPAQSAPQADAGQAAPDVTVHDMLDTDSAAVSRLRLTDRITGTAPFDAAIVKTIRQLAKTGVSAPTVALAAFTLLGVGLMLFRRRGNQTETARHRK